jgi:hypothetical protein
MYIPATLSAKRNYKFSIAENMRLVKPNTLRFGGWRWLVAPAGRAGKKAGRAFWIATCFWSQSSATFRAAKSTDW